MSLLAEVKELRFSQEDCMLTITQQMAKSAAWDTAMEKRQEHSQLYAQILKAGTSSVLKKREFWAHLLAMKPRITFYYLKLQFAPFMMDIPHVVPVYDRELSIDLQGDGLEVAVAFVARKVAHLMQFGKPTEDPRFNPSDVYGSCLIMQELFSHPNALVI